MTQEGIESPTSLCAAAVFADALAAQVNQNDVESIIQAQKHMMSRFEKTNEMLINCNALSTVRCHVAVQEFKRHTQLLLDMKKDLDCIFKRIRIIKDKLSSQHKEAFQAVTHDAVPILDEELDEETATCTKGSEVSCPSLITTQPDDDGKHGSSSCSQTTTPSPTLSSSSTDST